VSGPDNNVEMKQLLPNQLLQEYCKKEKRPGPLYKNISIQPGLFKFRVTLRDPRKDASKDLHFVSSNAVPNEELSKEEACLLALLNLQPTVPHERKLSEPYRTTWLHATGSLTQNATNMKEAPVTRGDDRTKLNDLYRSPLNGGAITEYERLVQASGKSQLDALHPSATSERQRIEDSWEDEVWKQRNAKIRRHEANRIASQNHQVVMSARMRKCIEQFLRDGTIKNEEKEDDDPMDNVGNDATDEINIHVQNRLLKAGFTRKQISKAYSSIRSPEKPVNVLSKDERKPDDLYEDCLQWLLIHLNEDQLPEGFDLREFELEVIVPGAKPSQHGKASAMESDLIQQYTKTAQTLGLTIEESKFIVRKAQAVGKNDVETFWTALQDVSSTTYMSNRTIEISNTEADAAITFLIEELETLDNIFGSEHSVYNSDNIEFTTIVLPLDGGTLNVEIVVAIGRYPKVLPERVCVWGNGWSSQREHTSVALHVELMKFISSLPKDEPMLFSIYSETREILKSSSLVAISLVPILGDPINLPDSETSDADPKREEDAVTSIQMSLYKKPMLRPRERKRTFWTVPPHEMPAARSFPKLSRILANQRTSLPAAQARDEFLNAMALASKLGRVLLVTGETGSGTFMFSVVLFPFKSI
jgi:ATP-dependent RNA helicase DHX57